MPLASSSSVAVRYVKEATFGVTPTTALSAKFLRITGETLKFNVSKESSKEINASRTINSMVPVTASASGGINGEVFYAGNDDLLESALQGTWVKFGTNGVGAATATTNITATTITASAATTGLNAFTNLKNGQWFSLEHPSGNNAGKILRVHPSTLITSTALPLDPATPATASSGESIQIASSRLTHGITQTSWSIERNNVDIGTFIVYRGLTPSKVSISISSGALSAMNFEFIGKDALESNVTNLGTMATAGVQYDIHSGVSGATLAVWMDGAPITGTYVKSVSIEFDNALRSQEAIGQLGAVAIGSGTINCTLNMQVYFANKDTFTKFRTNVNSSFVFSSTDAAGNGYIISIPKANFGDWTSNASAKDQDQMVDLSCTALCDASNTDVALQKLIFIDRVGDAVV